MRKAGVSKSVRMSITGHASKNMDDRNNRVDLQDQHETIKKLEEFFAKVDQKLTQRWSGWVKTLKIQQKSWRKCMGIEPTYRGFSPVHRI